MPDLPTTGPHRATGPDGAGQEPDDATLLARHVAGDGEAFAELVRRHRDRLWAVALRTLGDREEAADALQDGLLNAFRRAGSYRGDAAVTTWLHRIVVNACLDRARRAAVRPTAGWPVGPGGEEAVPAPGPESAERSAWRVDLQRALAQLPAEQRLAVLLVDVEGWSVAEAAAALHCAEGTVKSRCARGRARLLQILQPGNRPVPPRVPPTVAPRSRPGSAPASPTGHADHIDHAEGGSPT